MLSNNVFSIASRHGHKKREMLSHLSFFGDPYGNLPTAGKHATGMFSYPPFDSQLRHAKNTSPTFVEDVFFGDPYGNRTHVTAVKGRCLNRLTNGPNKGYIKCTLIFGSGTWIRTGDTAGMNRML